MSTASMPQGLLERYYAPSVHDQEEESEEEGFVSAGEEQTGDGGESMIEALMAHLEGSWDDEGAEEAVKEAVGWEWPMPPFREVWMGKEEGRKVQRSKIVEPEDESKVSRRKHWGRLARTHPVADAYACPFFFTSSSP